MSGLTKIINGEIAQSGTTGEAYLKELDKLSPEAIEKANDEGC